jgi:uncharacterized protein YbjT (DUF2867 family)
MAPDAFRDTSYTGMADLVLVTGATGNTGSAVLQQLETRGARVRAMVRGERDKARLRNTSATMVVGNFDDRGSLQAALEGVSRAYLVTPSTPEAQAQQVRFAELASALLTFVTLVRLRPPYLLSRATRARLIRLRDQRR